MSAILNYKLDQGFTQLAFASKTGDVVSISLQSSFYKSFPFIYFNPAELDDEKSRHILTRDAHQPATKSYLTAVVNVQICVYIELI